MILRHDRQSIIQHVLRLTLSGYTPSYTSHSPNIVYNAPPASQIVGHRDRRRFSRYLSAARPCEEAVSSGEDVGRLRPFQQGTSEIGSIREGIGDVAVNSAGESIWTSLVEDMSSCRGLSPPEEYEWYHTLKQTISRTTFPAASSSSHLQTLLSLDPTSPASLLAPTIAYLNSSPPASPSVHLLQLRLIILHHQFPSFNPDTSILSHRYFEASTYIHIGVLRAVIFQYISALKLLPSPTLLTLGIQRHHFDLPLLIQSIQFVHPQTLRGTKRTLLRPIQMLHCMRDTLGEPTLEQKIRILKYLKGYLNLGISVYDLDMTGRWREGCHKRNERKEALQRDVLVIWKRREKLLTGLKIDVFKQGGMDILGSFGGVGDVKDGETDEKEVLYLEIGNTIMDVMHEEHKHGYGKISLDIRMELSRWKKVKDELVRRLWVGLRNYLDRIHDLKIGARDGCVRPIGNESWMIALLARESILPKSLKTPINPEDIPSLGDFDINDPAKYVELLLAYQVGKSGTREGDDVISPRWKKDLTSTIIRLRNALYNTHRFPDILNITKLLVPNTAIPLRPLVQLPSPSSSTSALPLAPSLARSRPALHNYLPKTRPPRFDILQSLYTASYPKVSRLTTLPPPLLPGIVHSHLLTTSRNPKEMGEMLGVIGHVGVEGEVVLEGKVRRMLRSLASRVDRVEEYGILGDSGGGMGKGNGLEVLERCFEEWKVGIPQGVLEKIDQAEIEGNVVEKNDLQVEVDDGEEGDIGDVSDIRSKGDGVTGGKIGVEEWKRRYKLSKRTPMGLMQKGVGGNMGVRSGEKV